jgi:hypothetical protein
MGDSKHPGHWWICLFLYFITLAQCSISREAGRAVTKLDDINKTLKQCQQVKP